MKTISIIYVVNRVLLDRLIFVLSSAEGFSSANFFIMVNLPTAFALTDICLSMFLLMSAVNLYITHTTCERGGDQRIIFSVKNVTLSNERCFTNEAFLGGILLDPFFMMPVFSLPPLCLGFPGFFAFDPWAIVSKFGFLKQKGKGKKKK